MAGLVRIILQQPGAAGTQGTIAGNFVGSGGETVVIHADAQPLLEIFHGAGVEFIVVGAANDPHAGIDPKLEDVLLVELFPGFNPLFIGARIVDRGKTVGEEFILGQEDDFLKLLFSVGRNGLVKRFLGLVGYNAKQGAVRFAQVLSAYRIRSIICDTGSFKGFAVDPGPMAAGTFQIDGKIRTHCIQFFFGGKGSIRPFIIEPSPPYDPFSRMSVLAGFCYHVHYFLLLFTYDVQFKLHSARIIDVQVGIDESREYGPAV